MKCPKLKPFSESHSEQMNINDILTTFSLEAPASERYSRSAHGHSARLNDLTAVDSLESLPGTQIDSRHLKACADGTITSTEGSVLLALLTALSGLTQSLNSN